MSVDWKLVGATILPNIGGWVGTAVVIRPDLDAWHQSLKKPRWKNPDWSVWPIWTTLYSSAGYASYLVLRDGGGFNGAAKIPLIVYGNHLIFNWAWTPIYFGARDLKWAFYELQLVTATAAATGYLFSRINKTAGFLFIPYLLWLGYSSAVYYRMYRDNPDKPKIEEIVE